MGTRTHSFDLKTLQVGDAIADDQIGSLTLDDLHIEKGGSALLIIKRGAELVTKIDTSRMGGEWRCATWVDRDQLVIGSAYGEVSLVDAHTGKLKRRFVAHVGNIWAIAPSPDRRYLLTASQDSTLRIWSMDSSSPLLTFYFSDDGEWIAGARKGYYAASPAGERLMGWRVSNGINALASFYPAAQFRKVLYRPDVIGRLIDTGGLEKALADADAAAGKSTRQAEIAQILPPRIAITSPVRSTTPIPLTDKSLEIAAVARSTGSNPITSLRLLLDDRPIADGLKTFPNPVNGEARANWTVEVPSGAHRLAVEASTAVSKGVSEPVNVIGGDDASATGKLFVVVIGINDYMNLANRFKLDSAVPDAQAINKAFQDLSKPLFRSVESRMLLDRQATRANILDALRWLKTSASPGDKVIVFYAGHGDNQITGQFYLLPVDAKIDDLRGTGISDDDLQKAIGELPCSTVLMLDACYSGSFGQKKKRKNAQPREADRRTRVVDGQRLWPRHNLRRTRQPGGHRRGRSRLLHAGPHAGTRGRRRFG